MTDLNATQHNEKLHKLHHNIQNCLNVISLGADALRNCRHDDAEFAEFHATIQQQRKEATRLVDELFKMACDRG